MSTSLHLTARERDPALCVVGWWRVGSQFRAFGDMNRRSDTTRCIPVHSSKSRSASISEYSTCSEWKRDFVALGSLGA